MSIDVELDTCNLGRTLLNLQQLRSQMCTNPSGAPTNFEVALEESDQTIRQLQTMPIEKVRPLRRTLQEIHLILQELGPMSRQAASFYGGWQKRQNLLNGGYDGVGQPREESTAKGNILLRG